MKNKDKLKRIGNEVHLAIMNGKKPKLSAAKKIVDILMKVTDEKIHIVSNPNRKRNNNKNVSPKLLQAARQH